MSDTTPTPKSVAALQAEASERIRGNAYPQRTKLTDMTVEERVEYWKAQAEKHKARADERVDYDELKRQSDVLAYLKANGHVSADEELAPDPPEAEAENAAWAAAQAERTELRRSALLGEFIAATGHQAEFFDVYLPYVTVDKFFNDDGTIDRDAVKDAARHFRPASQPSQPNQTWNGRENDPIAAAMARIGNADDIDTQVGQAVKRLGG